MANRIVGNIYILDSSAGATADLSWLAGARVAAIGFWAANTSGEMVLTMGQSNQIVHFSYVNMTAVNSGVTLSPAYQSASFASPLSFQSPVQLQTLTAGTGWIYFA